VREQHAGGSFIARHGLVRWTGVTAVLLTS